VPHTCLSTIISQDHVNLDSHQIVSIVVNSLRTNPSIPVKSLIAKIKNRYGYTVMYRKAWMAKQKALAMEFGDWEDSYNYLPRWLHALQESLQGIIAEYVTQPVVVNGVEDNSCHILERVFWAFNPCIDWCQHLILSGFI